MTKFDYEKTAKFDMSISGWGGEDVKFFENCIQSKVDLLSLDMTRMCAVCRIHTV